MQTSQNQLGKLSLRSQYFRCIECLESSMIILKEVRIVFLFFIYIEPLKKKKHQAKFCYYTMYFLCTISRFITAHRNCDQYLL